jgi:hypothetical protein
MKIEHRIVDDLKTERPDISPSLPAYLRLVPILFYTTILGGILLSAFFLFVLQNAAAAESQWNAQAAQRTQDLDNIQADRSSMEKQAKRANDIVAWVGGARSLQPLVVAIIRSMDSSSSIVGLALTRDPATPTQIKFTLQLNTQGARQLDATLEKITALNFRAYNPNQTQTRGETDYEATLIYQSVRAAAPSAQP